MPWTTKNKDNLTCQNGLNWQLNVTRKIRPQRPRHGVPKRICCVNPAHRSHLSTKLTMKTIAAALVMAGSAAAFSPASTTKTSTATAATPDRLWDTMVDKTERSAAVPFLPKAPALDGTLPGDQGFDPFFLSSIPKNFAGFLQPPSWEDVDGISTIYWMST